MKKLPIGHCPSTIDTSWRIGIVYAPYYKEEVESMVNTAREILMQAGIPEGNITLHAAPGSFEIPLIGRMLARQKKVDALMAFGIIVQGETYHDQMLATETGRAIMDIQMEFCMPFALEILHVKNIEQARARALGPDNKGKEAANAVLHSLAELCSYCSN